MEYILDKLPGMWYASLLAFQSPSPTNPTWVDGIERLTPMGLLIFIVGLFCWAIFKPTPHLITYQRHLEVRNADKEIIAQQAETIEDLRIEVKRVNTDYGKLVGELSRQTDLFGKVLEAFVHKERGNG